MIGDKKIKNNQSGFSLLEMLVATSIFVVVIVMVLSIFQNSIMIQRNAIAVQGLQEGIRYAMEVISKEVRSANANWVDEYDPDPTARNCSIVSPDTENKVFNFDITNGFYFRNRLNECVRYTVETNRLMIERINSVGDSVKLPITPVDIEISDWNVAVDDDLHNTTHTKQPNVTFVFDIKSKKWDGMNDIKLQTSITSRHYE